MNTQKPILIDGKEYVLVPVEPTPEMIQGFWGDITHGEAEIAAAKEAWRRAIDAAIAQQKGQP